MKQNLARVLSVALVLVLCVALFAGCKPKDPVTKTDVTNTDVVSLVEDVIVDVEDLGAPFTIEKLNGKDVIILTPGENDSVVVTVAENTTLEVFLSLVKAEEGYAVKVFNADGTEVTDTKAIIAKDMKFEVYADGKTEAQVSYAINVISEAKIEQTVKEQEKIDQINSSILASHPSVVPVVSTEKTGSDSVVSLSPSNFTPVPPLVTDEPFEIVLASVEASSYTANNAYGKAWQSVLTNMKKKKGITTTIRSMDPNTVADNIIREVMAGKSSADVFQVPLVVCRELARKKAIANMFASTTLNKSLYSSAVTESCTFKGKSKVKAYGVNFGDYSASVRGVLYNKELIKKYASDYDIPTLYDTKQWTFDTFREIAALCTQDTNGDNKNDVFGFTTNSGIVRMVLTANAGGIITMNNGRAKETLSGNAGVAALQWGKDLYRTDRSWKYMADIKDCINVFAYGEAAMFVSDLTHLPSIASKTNFEIGYVPMPIGPDQKDYVHGAYDGNVYMVTKLEENRLYEIGIWLNEIAVVSSKLMNASVKTLARYGLDAHSQNAYKQAVLNMSPEFSQGPFIVEIVSACDAFMTNPSGANSFQNLCTKVQKECDEYYEPFYKQ